MIHRAEHSSDFSQIDNALLRDTTLSDGARSLLFFMLSMSDEWTFSIKVLANQFAVETTTIQARISELKSRGYIQTLRLRGEDGRFSSCTWDIYEKPQGEFSTCGENHTRNLPHVENTTRGSNHVGKNTSLKNINIKEHQDIKNIKEKEEKAPPFAKLLEPLSPELKEVFENFIKMRKTIKAPLTEKALDLAIKRAFKLAGNDPEKVKAIVEQSILNSWRGLFELKEKPAGHCQPKEEPEEIDWDEIERMTLERMNGGKK